MSAKDILCTYFYKTNYKMEIAGKIKVNELLCNISLEIPLKEKLRKECYRIEDIIVSLDFKYVSNKHIIEELNKIGNVETAKMLEIANESIKNDIKSKTKTLNKLYKLL